MRGHDTEPMDVQRRAVIHRVRVRLDELVERSRRKLDSIAFYASGGAGTPEELALRLRANFESALDATLGGERDHDAPAATGRLRARQGAPLVDVLAAYRLGYTEAWAALVEAARTEPLIPPDVMVDLALDIFELYNDDAQVMAQAYHEESEHRALLEERERAAMVGVLLAPDTSLPRLLNVVRVLKFSMEGSFLVVAAASDQGHDPMPRVSAALAALDVKAVWRLHYDIAFGVLSLPKDSRSVAVLELLSRHATGAVGVSPVISSLEDAAWAADIARLVLTRLGTTPVVEQFSANPIDILVAGGRDAAQKAARRVLGGLLELPEHARDLLLETLDTWVEAGGSANVAGERLHCHANTVRKRLHRLEECTGRTLTEPGGAAELIAAARAWRQLEPSTHATD